MCLERNSRAPEEEFEIAGCTNNPHTMAPRKSRENKYAQVNVCWFLVILSSATQTGIENHVFPHLACHVVLSFSNCSKQNGS